METIWPKNHMDYVNYIIQYVMFFLAAALVHSIFGNVKHTTLQHGINNKRFLIRRSGVRILPGAPFFIIRPIKLLFPHENGYVTLPGLSPSSFPASII